MNTLQPILVGVLFGIWPLFMNKSGLGPQISMVLYCVGVCSVVLCGMLLTKSPFTIGTDIRWGMFFVACALGGTGLSLFGNIIANSAPAELSKQLVIVTIVSILAPFLYYVGAQGAGVEAKKIVGFLMSIVGAYLLLSK